MTRLVRYMLACFPADLGMIFSLFTAKPSLLRACEAN